jgi:lipopolysaccharide/colanic/teichoic acid biosynthesis glycosyltransferase
LFVGRLSAKPKERILVGALDSVQQRSLPEQFPEVPWLGDLGCLREVVLKHSIQEIFATLPVRSCFDHLTQVLAVAKELGIPVLLELDLVDWMGKVSRVGGDPLLVVYNQHPANLWPGRGFKRAVDIAVGVSSLIILSPLFLLAAAAVKLTSPGPVFFRQTRLGLRCRPFRMYKFRTMVQHAEELRSKVAAMNDARGISFKIYSDPRLTKLGYFLRRSSIDELPQLFNVLKGEMSLVGPRPLPLWVGEKLRDTRFHRRFSVLPGMTGFWQVNGRRQDFDYMAELDVSYVDQWSFSFDLKILAKTIPATLKGEGAH